MKNQILVNKYAQGLVQAVKDEGEFAAVRADLLAFLDLHAAHAGLRNALASLFIEASKKAVLLETVLAAGKANEKTVRFLKLLLEHGRLDLAGEITAALPEAWNEKLGILTFEVTSVIPLTDTQKTRLRETLEVVEERPVSLVYRIDPGIVGGLALKRGHIVYDVSIQGNLDRMKDLIQQG